MVFEQLKNMIRQRRNLCTSASRSFRTAQMWCALVGENDKTRDFEYITGNILYCCYQNITIENAMKEVAGDIYKDQFWKTLEELDRLIALSYLQKMRIEAHATKDNWASDALGPVNMKIQKLEDCRRQLNICRQSHFY